VEYAYLPDCWTLDGVHRSGEPDKGRKKVEADVKRSPGISALA
jgi:hypothetical protein